MALTWPAVGVGVGVGFALAWLWHWFGVGSDWSWLAESVPAESVPADSKKLTKKKIAEQSAESQSRTKKDKIAELPKKTIRPCVNHEKTRKQFLVRTGLKNVSFRYGGSDKNRWASEGEAKKAAHEFFEANKAAHE